MKIQSINSRFKIEPLNCYKHFHTIRIVSGTNPKIQKCKFASNYFSFVSARRTNERGSPESPGLERMPAEMYVPNQEQWLELRASKKYNFCCTEYWPNNVSTNLLLYRINREILKLRFISFVSKNVPILYNVFKDCRCFDDQVSDYVLHFAVKWQNLIHLTYNFTVKIKMLLGNTTWSLNSF